MQFELRKKDEEREFERLKIAAEKEQRAAKKNRESMRMLNLPESENKPELQQIGQRSLRE